VCMGVEGTHYWVEEILRDDEITGSSETMDDVAGGESDLEIGGGIHRRLRVNSV